MRYPLRIITLMSLTLLMQCCTTTKENVFLGIGIGSAIGAGVASLMKVPNKNHIKSIGLGIGIGATLGGAAGYYESKKKMAITNPSALVPRTKGEQDEDLPMVTKPIVKKIWIPDRIEYNQLVKGHHIYVIERPSVWSTESTEAGEAKNEKVRPSTTQPTINR